MTDTTQAPERIFLQDAGDYAATAKFEVTWCVEAQDENDTEYVRADLFAAAEARARESALDALAAYGQAAEAHEAQLAAEAKLATARGEALPKPSPENSTWTVCPDALIAIRDDAGEWAEEAYLETVEAIALAAIRALAKGGK